MSKAKAVLLLANTTMFGWIVNSIFIPAFAPHLMGQGLGTIIALAASGIWALLLLACLWKEALNLIIMINIALMAVVTPSVLIPSFAPQMLGYPIQWVWVLGVVLGWTLLLWILLQLARTKPEE